MSNYNNLKSAIQAVIKTNGNNEITGQILQDKLLSMIATLGLGYQFMGIAYPNSYPGTPDAKIFYIAYEAGTYTYMGGIVVTGLCVLRYDTNWVKEDIPIAGGGGGADFTVEQTDLNLSAGENPVLKFADRKQGINITTGKNYIIVRENATLAAQLTVENAIYEIRYDFYLGDTTLTIPANSILFFNGGCIKNGTVVGNYTRIIAPIVKIFDNVTTSGKWAINEVFPEWFGAVPDDTSVDNSVPINKALTAFKYGNQSTVTYAPVVLTQGRYYVQHTINIVDETTLRGNGYNANGLVRVTDANEEAIIYVTGTRFLLSHIFVWGVSLSSDNKTKTGVQMGDTGASAVRGIVRAVIMRYCKIGLDLKYQWCNTVVQCDVRQCTIGVLAGETTPYISNFNIEGCGTGVSVPTGSSGIKAIKCVIEGNGIGCVIDSGENSFINCYFEANTESSISNSPVQEQVGVSGSTPVMRDVNGGHIVCGETTRAKTLTIIDCRFSNSNTHQNRILVDQCSQFNCINAFSDISPLVLTKNCIVGNVANSGNGNSYTSAVNPNVKSFFPAFACNDFSWLYLQQYNVLRYINSDYFSVLGNTSSLMVDSDGHVISYRTAGTQKRYLGIILTIDNFISRKKDVLFVMDYELAPALSMAIIQCDLTGSATKRIETDAPTTNPSANKRSSLRVLISKEDLAALDENNAPKYTQISFRIYDNYTAGYVDAETDKEDGKAFKLLGVYLYEGTQIPSEMANNVPAFSRVEFHRGKALEGVIFPLMAATPNFQEIGLTYVDSATKKLVYYQGSNVVISADGKTNAITVGQTSARPSLQYWDRGYTYYDLNLLQPIFFAGSGKWIDATGSVAGARRKGTTDQRPTDIAAGYVYFDTTLGKPVFYDGTNWVDATGTTV